MTDARREPVSEWIDPKEWESREGYAEARAMWCRLKGYPDDFPITLQCEYSPIDKLRQELVQRDTAQREQLRALADRLAASEKLVEQQRVQLAGCLTAAEGHTKNPATKGAYGWSVAYQATLDLRLLMERLQLHHRQRRAKQVGGLVGLDGEPLAAERRDS